MRPSLYHWYSTDAAVAAFGEAPAAERLCDGQFAVLPSAILCFATLGEAATQPYMLFPSSFVWKPGRSDYAPGDEVPWLPAQVREVRGPGGAFTEHHLFLRAPGDESFVYVGAAHLGSWGDNQQPHGKEAGFSLDQRLPRDVWLRLGGYAGWRVELNHQGDLYLDPGDVAGFGRLVEEFGRAKSSHLYVTRYEEDALTVHTNARRGWLVYQRSLRDFGSHSQDPHYSGDRQAEELFLCACGIDLEVRAEQTLPRELCMRAAVEFFQTGTLPRCVAWAQSD